MKDARTILSKLLAAKASERDYIQRTARKWLNHPDSEVREFARKIYKPSADSAVTNRGKGRNRKGVA